MGYAKYKMNDLKNALKDIQRSIALDPSDSYAYRNRALVYLAMKQTDKACEPLFP
jgi:regulator of sirC expression with transglutaminase-like and TPR domain